MNDETWSKLNNSDIAEQPQLQESNPDNEIAFGVVSLISALILMHG